MISRGRVTRYNICLISHSPTTILIPPFPPPPPQTAAPHDVCARPHPPLHQDGRGRRGRQWQLPAGRAVLRPVPHPEVAAARGVRPVSGVLLRADAPGVRAPLGGQEQLCAPPGVSGYGEGEEEEAEWG